MQCSELELVFEQEGLAPLSAEARQHLSQCSACKHFVEDVTTIVAVAHELPAEIEPPEHVWVSIREQLVLEGTVREFSKGKQAASWWQTFGELFRNRVLATATLAAVLVVAGLSLSRTPPETPSEIQNDPYSSTVSLLSAQEHDLANMQLASTSAVDTSLRQNLQQVNDFIADCERHAKEEPSDELTREYLTNAYQQKAALLSAMMDRGGSLN
jgi:anti-sigma-K factor RskA